MDRIEVSVFGGVNYHDPPEHLFSKAFSQVQGGYQQTQPVESPEMLNMDFDPVGIRKRFGSSAYLSVTGLTGEVVIGATSFTDVDGAISEILVGSKTIYRSTAGGALTQLKVSGGASNYTHSATVSKCSFAVTDGHLFIGIDGTNAIQVYRTGTALDPPLAAGNLYYEAYAPATSHTVTGTWDLGAYILSTINTRLVWSTGDSVVNATPMAYTASSGIWDWGGSTAAFRLMNGPVNMLASHSPQFTNQLQQTLYIGTPAGIDAVTGFAATDEVVTLAGVVGPVNHKAHAITRNWVIFLGGDRNLYGLNGAHIIDLGRRFRNMQYTGPLDTMDSAFSSLAFGYYNYTKKQVMFFVPTATSTFTNQLLLIDFANGEPSVQDSSESAEQRSRCLMWMTSGTSWFVAMFSGADQLRSYGMTTGTGDTLAIYKTEQGNDDLALNYIDARWSTPRILGPGLVTRKKWFRLVYQYIARYGVGSGVYDGESPGALPVTTLIDGGSDPSAYMLLTYEGGAPAGGDRVTILGYLGVSRIPQIVVTSELTQDNTAVTLRAVDLYAISEGITIVIQNKEPGQTFILGGVQLTYIVGAEIVN